MWRWPSAVFPVLLLLGAAQPTLADNVAGVNYYFNVSPDPAGGLTYNSYGQSTDQIGPASISENLSYGTFGPVAGVPAQSAYQAQGASYVDDAAGVLRASMFVKSLGAVPDYVGAGGYFYDQLTYHLAPGQSTGTVTFTLSVDGTTQFFGLIPGASTSAYESATWDIQTGSTLAGLTTRAQNSNGTVTGAPVAGQIGKTAYNDTIRYSETVTNGESQFVKVDLNTVCELYGNGQCAIDFGSTAQAGIILGNGVSYTSTPGSFLNPVPLPGALWLTLSGLGLMAALFYRQRLMPRDCLTAVPGSPVAAGASPISVILD